MATTTATAGALVLGEPTPPTPVFKRLGQAALVIATLATIVLLTFMGIWNAYLIPLVYLAQQRSYQTLTIALIQYSKRFQTLYHIMAAGAIIALVPVIIIFIALQRHFIRGLTEGATKG